MGLLNIFKNFKKTEKAEQIDFKKLIDEYILIKNHYASYLPSTYDLQKKFIDLWQLHSEKIKFEKELLEVFHLIRTEKYSELGKLRARSEELGAKLKRVNAEIRSLLIKIEYVLEILSKSENKKFSKEVKKLLSRIDNEKAILLTQEKIKKRMTA